MAQVTVGHLLGHEAEHTVRFGKVSRFLGLVIGSGGVHFTAGIVGGFAEVEIIGNLYLIFGSFLDVKAEIGDGIVIVVHTLVCRTDLLVELYFARIQFECLLQLGDTLLELFVLNQQATVVQVVLADEIGRFVTGIEELVGFAACSLFVTKLEIVVEHQTVQDQISRGFRQGLLHDLFRFGVVALEEEDRCVTGVVAGRNVGIVDVFRIRFSGFEQFAVLVIDFGQLAVCDCRRGVVSQQAVQHFRSDFRVDRGVNARIFHVSLFAVRVEGDGLLVVGGGAVVVFVGSLHVGFQHVDAG